MRNWKKLIIPEAARIAASYTTAVTLRQLHYRLVAANVHGYLNNMSCYKQLSAHTSEARRAGLFPPLSDFTRGVNRPLSFTGPADAIDHILHWYRRDSTEGQEHQVWLLYEKASLGAQIESWVDPYGLPTAALRGYSSESLEREIFHALEDDGRPVVVFYVGDLDPEGEDIERNFIAQAIRQGVKFEHWERLTVTLVQANAGLAGNFNPGKDTSSRAPKFIAKYGRLFQIEVEAVDPAVLEGLVTTAITDRQWFTQTILDNSLYHARRDLSKLRQVRATLHPRPR